MVYCASKLIEKLKLFYKSNRPHFLWVYRRDNPLGMLGEHSKSFLEFSQKSVGYHVGKPIESVVYCLNQQQFTTFTETIMHLVYLPPPLPSPEFCITIVSNFSSSIFFLFFFFSNSGYYSRPKKNGSAKFGRVNKVHYGLCENGECKNHKISRGLSSTRDKFPYLGIFLPVFNVNLCYAANQQRKLVSGKQ